MEYINHEIGESIIFLSVLILLCKILTYEEYQNCYGNTWYSCSYRPLLMSLEAFNQGIFSKNIQLKTT